LLGLDDVEELIDGILERWNNGILVD